MSNNNNQKYQLNEDVSFVQHFLPGLDAGEYRLQVNQQVFKADCKTPVSGEAYSNAYKFAVLGDRFSLSNPASVINSIFPNDQASGEFSSVLPHVVFTKTTFPWIRYPTTKEPYTPPSPGKDVDGDVPTWLWIMLLDEDDMTAFPGLDPTPLNCTIADLYSPSFVPGSTLPNGTYSYFYDAKQDDLFSRLEPGQQTTDQLQAIDIPLGLFWQLAPTVADLELLAHGRIVSVVNQPTSDSSDEEPTGTFSIVFGNRLPASQKKTWAFLVSLEELEVFLPQTGGLPSPSTSYKPTDKLRLAVLKSWTFFSTRESATFVHQLESLNGCKPGGPPAENTNIRLPYNGSNQVVSGALNMGYVPLNEIMRTSEKNVSWYRGPLQPYSTADTLLAPLITSPDAATIFDPTSGMLDASYAAAWTIGRMLALQDLAFSTGLYNWKRSLRQQVNSNIENNLLAEQFSLDLKPLDDAQLKAGTILKQTVLKLNGQ